MAMNVSIILGHPTPGSFNHAVAAAAVAALHSNGHTAWFHDLYAENFDPLMTSSEIARDAVLPPVIERHCREIEASDGIIIVHPNWWSQPPAIIRGWTDRVLRPGRAYQFIPDGHGGGKSVGLLKARVGMVFNSANTPQEKEEELFGDPLEILWRKVVFGLCGVTTVFRRNFSPVIVSTLEQRQQWLREAREAVAAHFPATREDVRH